MITAVDSSVLLDIFSPDETYGPRSASVLSRCVSEGPLIACEVVWAKTGAMFSRADEFLEVMRALGVSFSPIEERAAVRSSQVWRRYRRRRSRCERVIADFLIGAHALEQADRLLTRDRGFYRDYFAGLRILDPSAQ